MENRDRDRVRQRTAPTDAGQINRRTSDVGGELNSGTSAESGQSTGRSENLTEGGEMNRNRNQEELKNKNREELKNKNIGKEPTRRPDRESYESSIGRSGSVDNMGGGDFDVSSEQGSKGGTGRSGSKGGSSQGRH